MLLEADGASKVGAVNQWVRVRDSKGHEGFAAAWYLEKVQTTTPAAETVPASTSTNEAGTSSKNELVVMVKGVVGKHGTKIFETASKKSKIVSTEIARAKLVVLEDVKTAQPKIGKAGKWLNVQTSDGKKGFVDAEIVKLV